jgi:hypothetical protein
VRRAISCDVTSIESGRNESPRRRWLVDTGVPAGSSCGIGPLSPHRSVARELVSLKRLRQLFFRTSAALLNLAVCAFFDLMGAYAIGRLLFVE